MNILVTVGTTPFDSLVRAVDSYLGGNSEYNISYQVSKSDVKISSGRCFDFVDNIDDFYKKADVIFTHAGAGSIYKLLEMNKKIVIVPNLERIDKHQADIARFMESNNYALVLWDFEKIPDVIHSLSYSQLTTYKKESFFKTQEIIDFLINT